MPTRKPNRRDEFDSDADDRPTHRGQLSTNEQWLFGSLFAALVLIGFGFGVFAGASRSKPTETAENKKEPEKPKTTATPAPPTTPPATTPPVTTPANTTPSEPEPKPKEPEPKAKEPEPEPKPKEPEPKPKEPEPKPKEPEPKKPELKAVAFKEVAPILRTYCGNCHGGAGKPKGGVDLTTVEKMLRSKGPPLVAGKPEESSLYVTTKNGEMPPDGKPGPSPKELQLIHDWIAGGAKPRRTVRGRRNNRPAKPARMELTSGGSAG